MKKLKWNPSLSIHRILQVGYSIALIALGFVIIYLALYGPIEKVIPFIPFAGILTFLTICSIVYDRRD